VSDTIPAISQPTVAPGSVPAPVFAPTTAAPAPVLPPLPNFAVRKKAVGTGTAAAEVMVVTFGNPIRTIEVKPLDLGEQWDLSEITGGTEANDTWRNMAQVAASVLAVDNVPPRPPRFERGSLRDTLSKIGLDGLQAVSMALGGVTTSEGQPAPDGQVALLATAGNSPGGEIL
jgi:hypothetical protein